MFGANRSTSGGPLLETPLRTRYRHRSIASRKAANTLTLGFPLVSIWIGAFPAALARVHPRHRSPVLAIAVSFVLTVAVLLGLGLAYNPVNGFAMTGTGIVIVLVAIYILMNVACIGYFARRRSGFNVLSHLVIPVLGVVVFVPAWLSAAGLPVFSFISALTPPLSYMGPAVGVWMVLGLIYLIYLYRSDPQRVVDVGLVHLDPLEEYES